MNPQSELAASFDSYYYAHGCGQPYEHSPIWLKTFGKIADRIILDLEPQRVLDAGCAFGFLTETLRARGVEAYGIDISEYAVNQAHPDVRPYLRVGSIAAPFEHAYDLITCIEVLEHMPTREAEAAVANFCRSTIRVLFSSTPFDFREATHVNVQPPEYWAGLFAQHGFYRDVDYDASFITPWAVCFRRSDDPPHRRIRDYERRFWQIQKENADLRSLALELRTTLAQAEQERTEQTRQTDQYLKRLTAEIERKDRHILHLEAILRRIENGRILRLLRLIQHLLGSRKT